MNGKLVKTLEGHEAAVWGVLALDEQRVATGIALVVLNVTILPGYRVPVSLIQ